MKKNIAISVSTDPIPNYSDIIDYAQYMQTRVEFLHCDVMDGKFVEKVTYDASLIKNINLNSLIMLDVHLMVDEPAYYIDDYINAGANILTIHYEAFKNKEKLPEAIHHIKERNTLVGLSIKPATSFKEIRTFAYTVDVILVMSVEPGLSGQKFMPEILDKIAEINKFREENNLRFKIEVDGGVNATNAKSIIDAGADILVSGMYVYGAKNRDVAIEELRGN